MLTLLALLAGAAPAPHATLSAPPRPLISGRAWNATLVVKPAPRTRPKVVARPPSGRSLVFSTRRVGRGRYKVRLVLPRVGRWTVSARIGTRSRVLRKVTVGPLAAADLAAARRHGVPRVRRSARALPPVRAYDRVRLCLDRLPRAACGAAHRPRYGARPGHDRRDRANVRRSRPEKAPCGRSRSEARPCTGSIPGRTESRRRFRSAVSCRTPGPEAAPCGLPTTRGRR